MYGARRGWGAEETGLITGVNRVELGVRSHAGSRDRGEKGPLIIRHTDSTAKRSATDASVTTRHRVPGCRGCTMKESGPSVQVMTSLFESSL